MRLKENVRPSGLRTEMLLAIFIAAEVWKEYDRELVVTSLNDSKHSHGSKHYSGLAADLRTRYFEKEIVADVALELQERVGKDYDVVVEKTHIHIEYHPKF